MRSQLLTVLLLAAASIASAEQAGGVKWTAPATWKTQPPKPMRAATYAIPAAAGDKDGAELAVYYFGRAREVASMPTSNAGSVSSRPPLASPPPARKR